MIKKETVDFLKKLKKNNSKEWFDNNRTKYLAAKENYLDFVTEILHTLKSIDPTLHDIQPKNCVFRINRDVRFSSNKNPYKTNFGASFSKGGKKIACAGYYFHLEPGACFIGGGYWMPMADDLNKIRQEIDYSFDEFKNIIQQRAFKNTFDTLDNKEILIRPPKGYEKDNPALEYLKLKNFIVMAGIEENELLEKDLIPKVISHFKIMKPLVDFLNRAIDS
jgi:uncharacterized protein (TIGR02453 family)